MTTITHGFSIGIERAESEFFITLKATGKLTHSDYDVITPMIDAALAEVQSPEVDVFVDITELEGWELRAAWDDFKMGLKHNNDFRNIAVVGNKQWQDMMAKIGSWFISGEVKCFEDADEALNWLKR